jgi:tryptophanyl-tRNA synthetase
MPTPRILSGVQPSGFVHIGNYFGAIREHLRLQHESPGNAFYFIADYHSLTTIRDPKVLAQNTMDLAIDYLALGLDPAKAIYYRQSDLPEVTELAWMLSTVTPMGLLERCTSYKDKIAKGASADHGLFAYPVLMAADILIVQSDIVPVGADQKQHVEVTRDIAGKFNNIYGECFKLPAPRIREETAVVPGIDGQKMSKSYGNGIGIFEEGKPLKKKVMSIVTDSTPVESPKDPDKCNAFALLKLFASEEETAKWRERYRAGGVGYGEVKQRIVALMEEHFADARAKRRDLEKNPDYVEGVLRQGAEKAREVAAKTLDKCRQAVGLRSRGAV